MDSAIPTIFQIAILIFSVVIHEVSHGFVALLLGDPTAKHLGRLTLNPLKHLDPFGSVILPLLLVLAHSPFLIGWAKPVPYNPYNLKNPFSRFGSRNDWGPALVGMAGPLSNILIALVFGIGIRVLLVFGGGSLVTQNLAEIFGLIVLVNLVLAVFNFVPIPPLDGSKVLFALLPYQWRNIETFLQQYGFFLLLIFIFFFSQWLFPVVSLLFRIFSGVSFF
ncbi:MAG: site-2 protease family protein [bacterium]|nr:site-2 protease family protein [bacterium]